MPLIRRLNDEHYDVLIPRAAGTAGDPDPVHFMCAIRTNRATVTRDHDDFKLLHDLVLLAGGHHPGILVIRHDKDPARDMSPGAIVRALHNLLASSVAIPDALHILNHWR